MSILPPSRGKIVFGLGIAYLLVQFLYVSYYNENRRFDNLITTTTQEYFPSTNPVPITHLNLSGIQTMFYNNIQTKETKDKNLLTPCPQTPPALNGTMRLLVPAQETLEEVAQQLSWLRFLEGGHQTPLDCQARYKIAIIVPYRNRLANLCSFLLNMHPFLTKQQLDYTIFIIEQFDDGLFNRAMLMNVGFTEALKLHDFDCFFFHDVDLIPENDRNIYSCPDQPRHMSVAIDKFNYRLPYVDLFGGVISMSRTHFQLVNGFSNMFWGWGGEDDDMASRVKAHDLNITRYHPDVARYHMLTHAQQKANPKRNLNKSNNSSDEDKDVSTSFFTWSQQKSENVSVENELSEFFKKGPTKKLNVLNSMPTLKKVFIQYNTPLPSSSAVERVFSVGGDVLSKKKRQNE